MADPFPSLASTRVGVRDHIGLSLIYWKLKRILSMLLKLQALGRGLEKVEQVIE